MSDHDHSFAPTLLAFLAGAAVGATAALLLTPMSGRQMRERLTDLGDSAADEVKHLAREARFRLAPKTKSPDYRYDGGDAWI